ncbi:antitoxin ChpS [Devosia sp. YR412]|uniref:AbrB/MazE/SpoVT family DNA-binding domain-containing protein n=1 Tax=Devosia sp. YR412 TaxID=1881030 RepID=UPI0008CC371E|nr:antitoxin [Devosia sp. YR412]SEP62210.1 antitoxin ChpS [Devosia sp. YR412]
MPAAKLRKVGGSAMLAIPPEMLQTMSVSVGAMFDVSIEGGALVARPTKPKYSLKQLLDEEKAAGITPLSEADQAWLDEPPVGRETW